MTTMDLLTRMGRGIRRMSSLLLGDLQWQPPGWSRRLPTITKGKKGQFLLLGILAITVCAWFRAAALLTIPPMITTCWIQPPRIPPLSESPRLPESIIIKFSSPVAPLSQVNHVVQGVSLEPKMEGAWSWMDDSRLQFYPKEDWPAAKVFSVQFSERFFNPKTTLAENNPKFKSKPFEAKVKSLEVNQDPRDENRRELVTTIEFNYRVDPQRLMESVVFSTTGGEGVFGGNSTTKPSTVKMARQGRLAFINGGLVDLPTKDDFIKVSIPEELETSQGASHLIHAVSESVKIGSPQNFFQIENITSQTVVDDQGIPRQLLVVRTTSEAKSGALTAYVKASLIPPPPMTQKNEDEESKRQDPYAALRSWDSISAISEETRKSGQPLTLKALPAEAELSRLHTFQLDLPPGGNALVTVGKGAKGYGGYELKEEYIGYLKISPIEPEIEFVSSGALLALNGEKKISIKTRRLPAASIEICRVFPDQVNHLVSQNNGTFDSPSFGGYNFDEENISVLRKVVLPVGGENDAEARCLSFDFSGELAKIEPRLSGGLFVVRLSGWNPVMNRRMGNFSRRFVLVTDLGIIAKKAADGSMKIFVLSVSKGGPKRGVEVGVLTKNGEILENNLTSEAGVVSISNLETLDREKTPVAILARSGEDLAFLPLRGEENEGWVDTSNFDTGGVELRNPTDLQTFAFTERGIYRPGDTVHIGVMTKQRDWQPLPTGFPISIEIFDSRDRSVLVEKKNYGSTAFADFEYTSTASSPTGFYRYQLYVGDGIKHRQVLWDSYFRVEEFQPDRIKLNVKFEGERHPGWSRKEDVFLKANLKQLFGAAAGNCRIAGTFFASPWRPNFSEYPGWNFWMPGKWPQQGVGSEPYDVVTDEKGDVSVHPKVEQYPKTGVLISTNVQGYEPDGGRSVGGSDSIPVAPFDYLIGWKSDQTPAFLNKDLPSSINLAAVNPDLALVALDSLKLKLIEIRSVSTLVEQENGMYAYRSVKRETTLKEEPLSIQERGSKLDLPTSEAGSFRCEIYSDGGDLILSLPFSVAGKGNPSVALEKSSEMSLSLSNPNPQPGEEITIGLTTPYVGNGLITLERDGVFAHQWFRADSTSSVQKIRIPENWEGTGYVVVSMVRSLESEEIFTSPHTFCAVPFEVRPEKRKLTLQLTTKDNVRPGEKLKIQLKADRSCKAVVFAVDEGIHQVSSYELPKPLDYFYQKRRLLVETVQIVDQLMPEFSLITKQSAFGGDDDLLKKNLNPFKRVTEKPVVYWSGVIEVNESGAECEYEVPDFFDGSLNVMAVAFGNDGADCAESAVKVAGPFVLQPSAPLFAAPGDEMIATLHITRVIESPSDTIPVLIQCKTSQHLKVVGPSSQSVLLAPGKDTVVDFTIRAQDLLGSAEIVFSAGAEGQISTRKRTLSIRPLYPFETLVKSGVSEAATIPIALDQNLRPEFRKRTVAASALPVSLAVGLGEYLRQYPYGCTEQTTSKAFCRLLLSDSQDFGLTREEAASQIAAAMAILRSRQANSGAFGYWDTPRAGDRVDWLSCYVVDFLMEAKSAGFDIPPGVLERGNKNLENIGSSSPTSLEEARATSYAIYLLTRQGIVTTNLLLHLKDRLADRFGESWKGDLTAAYVAGTHAMLLQRKEADQTFSDFYKQSFKQSGDFYSSLAREAKFLTLILRHDPDFLKKMGNDPATSIVNEIQLGRFNTLSGAYAVQALRALEAYVKNSDVNLGVDVWDARKQRIPFGLSGDCVMRGELPKAADKLSIRFDSGKTVGLRKVYYQLAESGFPKAEPAGVANRGIEIVREFSSGDNRDPATIRLGQELRVQYKMRTSTGAQIGNVAIVDLLPAGFELVKGEINPGVGSMGFDYVDVREDRVVYFGTISSRYTSVSYRLKPVSRGNYQFPPVSAASMYDRSITGLSGVGKIVVQAAK